MLDVPGRLGEVGLHLTGVVPAKRCHCLRAAFAIADSICDGIPPASLTCGHDRELDGFGQDEEVGERDEVRRFDAGSIGGLSGGRRVHAHLKIL